MTKHALARASWWAAAGVRALKTAAQTAVATIGTDVLGITDLDVASVASVSALAAALSILTSLGGLPEVPDEDTPSE